jgi:hypothetical protein
MLQRADGIYIGSAGNTMLAFDQSGNIKWTVPNDSPRSRLRMEEWSVPPA